MIRPSRSHIRIASGEDSQGFDLASLCRSADSATLRSVISVVTPTKRRSMPALSKNPRADSSRGTTVVPSPRVARYSVR